MNKYENSLGRVKGQQRVLTYLRKLKETKRYPNALLFHGPPGVGKTLCALEFAKYINMTGDVSEDERTFTLIERSEHPDVHIFSKGEDASFKIDIIRDVLEEARKPLFEARKRVLILEDIQDFPSYQQSDALLKTVEDGYEDTMFIFTTTEFDKVFSTLKSRTTSIQFSPLTEGVMSDILSEYSDSTFFTTAIRLSGGSLDLAKRFLRESSEDIEEGPDFLSGKILRTRCVKLLESLRDAPTNSILSFIDAIPEGDRELFSYIMMTLVKDVMLVEEGLDTHILNNDLGPALKNLAIFYEGAAYSLLQPLIVLNTRMTTKGIQFTHQLKNAVLTMKVNGQKKR